jgi:3-oxoacyl-[acyl-carrier-protein] synthase-3
VPTLTAPRYVLGEIVEDHTEITGFAERVAEFRMRPTARLWGWGTVRRTERSLADLAVECGSATLAEAGVDPGSVDSVVLCSTGFPVGTGVHGAFVERILTGLGAPGADFAGVGLNRCTNLLAGIHIADAYVRAGRFRRVLVITTDRVTDEPTRMDKFALFSDGAASCLVSADHPDGYELTACASATRADELDWAHEINPELAKQVNERLLAPLDLDVDAITALMHTNVYKPVIFLKEMQAGFTAAQLYLDNIPRIGHCFAADPLINLVDRRDAGHLDAGGYVLLAASVPGSRAGVLLKSRE